MTATSRILSVVILLVVLLAAIRHGEAIICYQCNSEYDPRCGDPFDPYTLGTVNCSLQPRLEHLSHIEPTLCRKLSQKIYGKTRVVRGCGYVKDEKDNNGSCMRRTGTHNVYVTYCSCVNDLCNSADNKLPSIGIIGTVIIFLAWKTIKIVD